MIKLTVLALFVALQQSSGEKEVHTSRRLLQVGNPYYNPGYPQYPPQPQFNCDPCNPYGVCYNMYSCWNQQQQPQQPVAPPPAVPAPPANVPPPPPPANQGPPPPVNGGTGNPAVVTPPAPPAVNPGPPAPPAVNPGPPAMPMPGAPQPGGLYPVGPGAPIMPIMPLMPPQTDITCGPPPATLCANRNNGPTGAVNPMTGQKLGPLNLGGLGMPLANNAKLYCDTPGACGNSNINWDVAAGTTAINQILCSEVGSCGGSTVNIKNRGVGPMGGNNVELSNLECGTGGCNGLVINGWGVSLNDVNCAVQSDCMGCLFRNMKTTPDMFCPDPYGPNAANNPNCAIEVTPCFGY